MRFVLFDYPECVEAARAILSPDLILMGVGKCCGKPAAEEVKPSPLPSVAMLLGEIA